MTPLYVYHYSTEKFDKLLTRHQRYTDGTLDLTKEDLEKAENNAKFRSDPMPYHSEISFMIDKLPFDIILEAGFDENHKVYKKGNTVYCYSIDINKLDPNMAWRLIESPVDTLMAKLPWFNSNFYKKNFFKIKAFIKKAQGYQNNDHKKLVKTVERFQNTYRKYYTRWVHSKGFAEQKNMYAASIPHIQLYPQDGVINIDKVDVISL
jgi:hypothetical protein